MLIFENCLEKKMGLPGFLYFSPWNLIKDSCGAKFTKENVIFFNPGGPVLLILKI